ncbi:ABC transporter ATP-binding protein [Falsihalocynthiibacter sp. S25ZX9]|uniref:ABC transporter ATP-binding protein n=1 Tax=Falsihalocynthiibacter sp. S25ZX9 TaxID=3240870 RepID=UPI00350F2E1D
MSSITFEKINISYGDFRVVRDLDLAIADREFIVLVGPSGCGKSTILRLIAGFEDTESGTLSIGNRVVNSIEPKNRNVSMVFQNYALYPHMTVRDNIAFGMKIRKMDKKEIERQIDEVVDIVNLRDQLHKKPGALSGGQRQRVALARAIVRKPEVFLFDEPLSNLDAEFRTSMRQEIAALHKRLESTMVYVTHDQVEAMTMGDKIAVLAPIADAGDSNLMQFGTPDELYSRPKNLFVAKFIGSPPMNFIDIANARSPVLNLDGAAALNALLDRNGPFHCGIRPEHITWGDSAADLRLDGTVAAMENLGHEQIAYLNTPIGKLTVRLPGFHDTLRAGAACKIGICFDRAHFFDAKTQERIRAPSN